VSVVCCQVEVYATGWSLVQRSPTECGVSNVCDHETSKNEEAQAHIGLSSHKKMYSLFIFLHGTYSDNFTFTLTFSFVFTFRRLSAFKRLTTLLPCSAYWGFQTIESQFSCN
jgi:hypothetical protein